MTTTHGQVKVVREAGETIRGDNVCGIQRKRDNLYGCSQSKCNKANCSGRCLNQITLRENHFVMTCSWNTNSTI